MSRAFAALAAGLAALAALLAAAAAPAAGDPRTVAPTGLVIAYSAAPGDRPALRRAMLADGVAALDRLVAAHRIAHYRLLWGRYADGLSWDMMLVLDLATPEGIAGWRAVEEEAPGGLPASVARLVRRIDTAPVDMMRGRHGGDVAAPVYLVVPYDYLVGVNDYVRYVDGYVVPQMDGWMGEGALAGYDFLLARYPAGRTWSAMLLLDYRGDAGLGQRDAVVARVRARLAAQPEWKALADNKQKIRDEGTPVIADLIATR